MVASPILSILARGITTLVPVPPPTVGARRRDDSYALRVTFARVFVYLG
jgi:hypothetical protein